MFMEKESRNKIYDVVELDDDLLDFVTGGIASRQLDTGVTSSGGKDSSLAQLNQNGIKNND